MKKRPPSRLKPLLNFRKIKRLRVAATLTMAQAAALADMNGRERWFLVESGRSIDIRLSTLVRVATALGVKPKELLK